jgi:hypothetical protein
MRHPTSKQKQKTKVRVADELRHVAARGSGGGNGNSSDANDSAPAAYVYTTHAWLLAMFFRCPARLGVACPSAHVMAAVARGIREGSVTWHAVRARGEGGGMEGRLGRLGH